MNYKTLRYSAIVVFILLIAIIFYSVYTWERLLQQGDLLQNQENELSNKITSIERNEQRITVDAYDTIGYPPLSDEQELELKKLRTQYEKIKLQSIENKGQGDIKKRDLLYKQINELFKKIKTLERNKQIITIEAHTAIVHAGPLSTEQKLELQQLRNQRDEINQSLKDIGRWDPDKRKAISLTRFGEPAMWIILPYFIFLIPILLSFFWNKLLQNRTFIYSCISACSSSLPVYFYYVLFPVKCHGLACLVIFMIAAATFILGLITFGITYLVNKRIQKSIT